MALRIMMTTGGTGGHIFPGLAVADALQAQGVEIHWLGNKSGMESKLVSDAGYVFHGIRVSGLRGKHWIQRLLAICQLGIACLYSLVIICRVKPKFVLAMGGYVSAPGGIAAYLTRTPLVIHEQNAIPGIVTRLLNHFAAMRLSAFPDTFVSGSTPVYVTGNPVRLDFLSYADRSYDLTSRLRLLVFGGSQGALILNTCVPQVLARLLDECLNDSSNFFSSIEVIHLTGRGKEADTEAAYKQAFGAIPEWVTLRPFCENMADVYAKTDLVLSRSGAMTVAEIAVMGLPSVLVPYPHAVDDHQYANANYLAKQKAAILIRESDLNLESLYNAINHVLGSSSLLTAMSEAAKHAAKPDATQTIVKLCQRYLS